MCINPKNGDATVNGNASISKSEVQREHETNYQHKFRYVGTDEPHVLRRKEILKKYPEIEDLYGPDIRLLYCCILSVTLVISLAIVTASLHDKGVCPTWLFVFLAWSIGGTINHSLSLANHELSHNLCFKTASYNVMLAMVNNIAQAIPSAVTFKRYHLEHHMYQGDESMDSDIASNLEVKLFNNPIMKAFWVFCMPYFYGLRPMITMPKDMSKSELINNLVVFGVSWFGFGSIFGLKMPLFLVTSSLLGHGLHPIAGHFISEHFTFNDGQETYSYYGPLNLLTYNVGYHNEHHDFPKISGFNLPKVKAIAPEFYDERWKTHDGRPMQSHNSWVKVLVDYIFTSHIGPHSRVKRQAKLNKKRM